MRFSLRPTETREYRKCLAGAQRIAVPVIVLGEYRLGIAQSRRRPDYENLLRDWITAVTVLDVDEETSTPA
jgi:predicted nucleic acid-binding protein